MGLMLRLAGSDLSLLVLAAPKGMPISNVQGSSCKTSDTIMSGIMANVEQASHTHCML